MPLHVSTTTHPKCFTPSVTFVMRKQPKLFHHPHSPPLSIVDLSPLDNASPLSQLQPAPNKRRDASSCSVCRSYGILQSMSGISGLANYDPPSYCFLSCWKKTTSPASSKRSMNFGRPGTMPTSLSAATGLLCGTLSVKALTVEASSCACRIWRL